MNIQFQGFDVPIVVSNSFVSEYTVSNHALFARIVQSLKSGLGAQAIEPYAVFDDKGKETNSHNCLKVITSPFDLPWADRDLMGALHERIMQGLFEEEKLRLEIDELACNMRNQINSFGLSFQSDYVFGVEWDLKKYLKSFGFQVDNSPDDSLLDSLIRFIALAFDVSFSKVLVFIGLENFLEEKDLNYFVNQAVFYEIPVLLLENKSSGLEAPKLEKHGIEQDFIEF